MTIVCGKGRDVGKDLGERQGLLWGPKAHLYTSLDYL